MDAVRAALTELVRLKDLKASDPEAYARENKEAAWNFARYVLRDERAAVYAERVARCNHQWQDARNKYVKSGEWCPRCGAIREGNRNEGDADA